MIDAGGSIQNQKSHAIYEPRLLFFCQAPLLAKPQNHSSFPSVKFWHNRIFIFWLDSSETSLWDDVSFSAVYGFDIECWVFLFSFFFFLLFFLGMLSISYLRLTKVFNSVSFPLLKSSTVALIKTMKVQLAQALDLILSIPRQWKYLNANVNGVQKINRNRLTKRSWHGFIQEANRRHLNIISFA